MEERDGDGGMVSLSKVRARYETMKKDRKKNEHKQCCSLTSCACGPVPTEMMYDSMCTHNLLTLQPSH